MSEQLQQAAAGAPKPEGSSVLLPPLAATRTGVHAIPPTSATGVAGASIHLPFYRQSFKYTMATMSMTGTFENVQ